jgi:predicted GNAT family acetyltransferase
VTNLERRVRLDADLVVRDRKEASRFEAVVDGQIAFLEYERRPDAIVLIHTEVPEALRGHGIARPRAEAAQAVARSEGLRVVVRCPFVRAYLRRHPDAAGPDT